VPQGINKHNLAISRAKALKLPVATLIPHTRLRYTVEGYDGVWHVCPVTSTTLVGDQRVWCRINYTKNNRRCFTVFELLNSRRESAQMECILGRCTSKDDSTSPQLNHDINWIDTVGPRYIMRNWPGMFRIAKPHEAELSLSIKDMGWTIKVVLDNDMTELYKRLYR
jgi:hypothetical protein